MHGIFTVHNTIYLYVTEHLCRNSAIGTKRSDHNKAVAALDSDHYRQIPLYWHTALELTDER